MQNSKNLFISYFFPPSDNISGIVLAKRIINDNKKVDVLTTSQDSKLTDFENALNPFIENKIIIPTSKSADSPEGIEEFIENSINKLPDNYKTVTSRSWLMSNHFLALIYKLKNPDVYWKAEFSDPLLHDIKNTINIKDRHKIKNRDFIDMLNSHIKDFPKLKYSSSTFYTIEYMTFLFADEIVFTNTNQKDMMTDQFPIDLKSLIQKKSTVSPHPTLPEKYYHLTKTDFRLNHDYINIAYFGNFHYPERNFNALFEAFDKLNSDKIRLYIFISNRKAINHNSKNIFIKRPLSYLEFLNATTIFDVLIVSDASTKDNWPVNPYLPSKLSDYLGSDTDIWAITEKDSPLDKVSVKYKSGVDDVSSALKVLNRISKNTKSSLPKRLFHKLMK